MRSMNRRRQSNSSDEQRRTDSGTNERNQGRRTTAQLERKRLQDRDSQRNVRQRTKNYVASLEARLAELESPDCTKELLRKNAELQKRLTALEEIISSICRMAESQMSSRESAPADEVSVKDHLRPKTKPSLPEKPASPPRQNTNVTSTSDDAIEAQRLIPRGTQPPSDLPNQPLMDTAASPRENDQMPVDVGHPLRTSGSESDETVDIQRLYGSELEMEFLDGDTNYDFNNIMTDMTGEKDNSAASGFSTASLDWYTNPFDSQLAAKVPWNSTFTPPFGQASNVFTSYAVDEILNSNQFFLSDQSANSQSISSSLSSDPGSFLSNQTEITYSMLGNSFDQFSLPRPVFDKPSYTVLSQHCPPTNIWDFKLTTHIRQRRSSQEISPIFSDFDDHGPNVSPFLGQPSSSAIPDPTSIFLAGSINRWKFQIPERLGLFWLHYIYLRYRVLPTLKNAQALPDWFTPRSSQCVASHPVWIDTLPWPRLRDKMTFEYLSFPFERFAPCFCASLNLNWEGDEHSTYKVNSDGTKTLTPGFIAHIKKLENWTLNSQFAEAFPQLATQVHIKAH